METQFRRFIEIKLLHRVKKFLASQRIIEDGERLCLGFTVTNDEEILMLAKRWMPHMRIIKPQRLQRRLEECAKRLLGI
jgi:predicted DNA-binding transcriptional regulator YafY